MCRKLLSTFENPKKFRSCRDGSKSSFMDCSLQQTKKFLLHMANKLLSGDLSNLPLKNTHIGLLYLLISFFSVVLCPAIRFITI